MSKTDGVITRGRGLKAIRARPIHGPNFKKGPPFNNKKSAVVYYYGWSPLTPPSRTIVLAHEPLSIVNWPWHVQQFEPGLALYYSLLDFFANLRASGFCDLTSPEQRNDHK